MALRSGGGYHRTVDCGDIDWSAVGAIGTCVGTLVTGAAAFVAWRALNMWREQLAGQSQHDLAKRLRGALRDVQTARDATLHDLQWASNRHDLMRAALGSRSLPDNVKVLDGAVQKLAALEGEVAVLWGDEVLALIVRIGSQSAALTKHVLAEQAPINDLDKIGARIVYVAPDIVPTYTRGTYQVALDRLTALAQEWVAPHVGRAGARRMSTNDLAVKRKQIDEAIKVMAEKEKATVDEERAEAAVDAEAEAAADAEEQEAAAAADAEEQLAKQAKVGDADG